MKRQTLLFLAVFILAIVATNNLSSAENLSPTVIPLWEGMPPGSEEFTGKERYNERDNVSPRDRWITDVEKPRITIYEPKEKKEGRPAVVIFPGGSYYCVAIDKEGHDLAKWLSQQGVVAGVVAYRLGGGVHQHPVPLSDAQQAIKIVRARAKQWNVDPNKVGVMGFSAGGHLASTTATHGGPDVRPNFAALIYPVISMRNGITHGGSRQNIIGNSPDESQIAYLSNDEQVDEKTPPIFLVHSSQDTLVPVENSFRFYQACRKNGVPVEMHIYPGGGHGYGMYLGPNWTPGLKTWLIANNWLDVTE